MSMVKKKKRLLKLILCDKTICRDINRRIYQLLLQKARQLSYYYVATRCYRARPEKKKNPLTIIFNDI